MKYTIYVNYYEFEDNDGGITTFSVFEGDIKYASGDRLDDNEELEYTDEGVFLNGSRLVTGADDNAEVTKEEADAYISVFKKMGYKIKSGKIKEKQHA